MIGLIYWCPVTHQRKEMALRSVHAEARCVDLCASVQLTQRYVNNTSHPVEAVYVFPLDSRAAVSGFEVEIDGVVTKADVQEKAEARQTYEKAKAAGDSAQLLEKVKDDVFQMSVGNLKPWSSAVIRITYVADIEIEGDGVLFFLPTFVAPRYTPAGAEAVPSASADAAPDGLRLELVAAMSSDIVSMDSQTEGLEIATTEHPGNARVRTATLRNAVMSLNKDLVVKIVTKEPHTPRCLVEHNPATNTYAGVVTLAPQIEFDDEPSELVFVVDRSGSMSGYNIDQAKKALELFFRSLPEDCYVNIVGFGSRFQTLWPKSVKYGAASLEKASRHIATLKADLGGTEIAAPLRQVLSQPPIKGYARQIFVLTDGQVSNTDETIAIVQDAVRAEPTTRVFALGLGNGASHELVEGIARAGHGTASFCVGDANLQEKVVAQLSRAIQPALTDVKIEWEGAKGAPPDYASDPTPEPTEPAAAAAPGGLLGAFAPSSIGSLLGFSARTPAAVNPADDDGFARAPFHAPPVHTGARFLSYCLVKAGGTPPSAVRITAKSPVGPLDVRLEVAPTDVVQGTLLHTMAARCLIGDLEKSTSWMHGSAPRSADPAAVKAEIVRLGTTYSLASKHTSFVAVQKRDGAVYEPPTHRPTPQPSSSRRARCSAPVAPRSFMMCAAPAGAAPQTRSFGGGGAPPGVKKSKKKKAVSGGRGGGRGGGGGGGWGRGAPMAARSSTTSMVDECMDDSFADMAEEACASWGSVDSSSDDDSDGCSLDSISLKVCRAESSARKGKGPKVKRDEAKAAKPVAVPQTPDALLGEIIKLQEFSGSFQLTAALATLIGCDLAAAQAVAAKFSTADGGQLVATALAIRFLRVRLSELQAQWKLVEGKAAKYVRKAAGAASIDPEEVNVEAARLIVA